MDRRQNKLVLADGLVKVIEERVTKTMPYSDFIKAIMAESSYNTGIMLPGTIFHERDSKGTTIVVEVPPKLQRIKYKTPVTIIGKEKTDGIYTFTVSMPYTYYFVMLTPSNILDKVGVYISTKPLNSEKDILCAPPIPNLYNSISGANSFCTGDIKIPVSKDVRKVTKDIVTSLMGSVGNGDLSFAVPKEILEVVKSYKILRKSNLKAITNPEFIRTSHYGMAQPLLLKVWEDMSTNPLESLKWTYYKIGSMDNILRWYKGEEHEESIGWN